MKDHGLEARATGHMANGSNNEKKEPLARSLGKFLGHLKRGFTEDLSPERHEVSRRVEEETREDDDGKRMTLRRTTIEELEVRDERGARREGPG